MAKVSNRNRPPIFKEKRDTAIRPRARDAMSRALAKAMAALADEEDQVLASARKSCLTCQWFNEVPEQCGLHAARPHARVIAYGCVDYVDSLEQPIN